MRKRKVKIVMPTEEEDREINAGIAADPDTYELSDEEIANLKPFRPGRPKLKHPKIPVTVRLDPQVVAFFRSGGQGWQTRLNTVLSNYVGRQRRRE